MSVRGRIAIVTGAGGGLGRFAVDRKMRRCVRQSVSPTGRFKLFKQPSNEGLR
jgi:hypothetical protein